MIWLLFWNTFQILIPMELILERLSLIDLSLAYFLSDQPGNGFFTLDTRRKARDCFKITFFSIFLCPQSPVFGPSFSHERVRLMSGKLLFMSGWANLPRRPLVVRIGQIISSGWSLYICFSLRNESFWSLHPAGELSFTENVRKNNVPLFSRRTEGLKLSSIYCALTKH